MASLDTLIESVPKISKRIIPTLKRLGIKTVRDLLFHFPSRYEDFTSVKFIRDVAPNETVTVLGRIQKISAARTARKRMFITEAAISDDTGNIKAIWFNQPFMARNLRSGDAVNLSGKAVLGKNGLYLQNPAYEKIRGSTSRGRLNLNGSIHTGGLVPIYPETQGITSRWLRYLIKNFLALRSSLEEALPPETRARLDLPEIKTALQNIHFPETLKEARAAERRFSFEELLILQLRALRERARLKQRRAPQIPLSIEVIKSFVKSLPFALTDAQRRSIWEILKDMEHPRPMNRLLEGDVGSGKTVVAASAALLVVRAGYQTAFMAPTEILARQHYETLQKVLAPFEIKIGLLTGSEKKSGRDAQIIVGTHALIQKNVKFENLGLVIIDEQHRFGVEQRAALTRSKTTNASESTKREKIIEKELSYKLGALFFKIQENLGRFCRERQYGDALEKELRGVSLSFKREYPIPIADRKSNFVDFVVEDRILIDLKAKPFVEKSDYYQMKRYLEISDLELGLIVNFQDRYLKPKRILNPKSFVDSDKFVVSDRLPHFLSMTATPIPRTLALTIYGDLDLSILDEMPKSRKPVITKIVEPGKRKKTYQFIQEEVKRGRQVFVICPRIERNDDNNYNDDRKPSSSSWSLFRTEETKAVKEEYEKLSQRIFSDLRIGMLHGRMKPKEKEAVMRRFKNGETDILVSTSVVEVGVDVPNAAIMMIEGAERFGLAQLHQFRGRVGRGAEQSYCLLFPTEDGMITKRLRAITEAKTGFELAELDLKIRGPGDIFGTKQWGVSDRVLKGLSDPLLVREVREEARELIKKSPDMLLYPGLRDKLLYFERKVHLE